MNTTMPYNNFTQKIKEITLSLDKITVLKLMRDLHSSWENIIENRNHPKRTFTSEISFKKWNIFIYSNWKKIHKTSKNIIHILDTILDELEIANKDYKFDKQIIQEVLFSTKKLEATLKSFEIMNDGTIKSQYERHTNKFPTSVQKIDVSIGKPTRKGISFIPFRLGMLFGAVLITPFLREYRFMKDILIESGNTVAILGVFFSNAFKKNQEPVDITGALKKVSKDTIFLNQKLKDFGTFIFSSVNTLEARSITGSFKSNNIITIQNKSLIKNTETLRRTFKLICDEAHKNQFSTKKFILKNNPHALIYE